MPPINPTSRQINPTPSQTKSSKPSNPDFKPLYKYITSTSNSEETALRYIEVLNKYIDMGDILAAQGHFEGRLIRQLREYVNGSAVEKVMGDDEEGRDGESEENGEHGGKNGEQSKITEQD